MGHLYGYSKWSKLFEQDQSNIPSIENSIIFDIVDQLNSGKVPGTSDKYAHQVWNSLTQSEIDNMTNSIKNYSKKLVRSWEKSRESYRFRISSRDGGPKRIGLSNIEVNENYEVATCDSSAKFTGWKSISDIVEEVNQYNSSVAFNSAPKKIVRKPNVKLPDSKSRRGYRIINAVQVVESGNSGQISQYAVLDIKPASVDPDRGGSTTTTKTKISATASGSKGFKSESFKLTNNDIIDQLISDISSQLKDANSKRFSTIHVISSASNKWGKPVPATHKKDGTVLIEDEDFKSDPFPNTQISDLKNPESKNKKLAYKRGETISSKIKKAAIEAGIATSDVKVSIEWRVTDTGGKVDPEDVDISDAGQYFKVEVGGLGTKLDTVVNPGEEVVESVTLVLGRIGIELINLDSPKSRGRNAFGMFGPRNIIVKKGGKFFKGGARGIGGNRNKFTFQGKRTLLKKNQR